MDIVINKAKYATVAENNQGYDVSQSNNGEAA